ncbi:Protein of unknown function DUF262 [Methylobacterium sp. ap11]|uniref:DUF262 domain-containing protein n=1 Tax=Methylobacterium sp. ap11 TaxID=1761799 RepID=UPI0008CD529A|nr:DUF262 domain-containing protein [Methylobacterium sp. ap11]SEO58249.1 Protein of unknown function DUF262 [Methylobacterium sp. ap11]
MKLSPSDPDIDTVIRRINQGDLDLQPDFQRGEVWTVNKKKKLIDSVLRNWYIPPIHTIVIPGTHKQDVLDGQQRLAAIRDFAQNLFSVDGYIAPVSNEISQLDGLFYAQLPADIRRIFDNFTLRIIRISDYAPEEPGELFYRLNTLTSITAAEQRNAFYGPVRKQVKKLVVEFEKMGSTQETIGFSNSRMAYDDVLSKLLCTIETRDLTKKLTAGSVSDRFRSDNEFNKNVFDLGSETIKVFTDLRCKSKPVRHNKASLLSWMILVATYISYNKKDFLVNFDRQLLENFESKRSRLSSEGAKKLSLFASMPTWTELLSVYTDRSTSRVSDVSSVIYRDFILNFFVASEIGIDISDLPLSLPRQDVFKIMCNKLRFPESCSAEEILETHLNLEAWGKF